MSALPDPAAALRCPARITEQDLPSLLHGLPLGVKEIRLLGRFTPEEFQIGFPGLKLAACLYAEAPHPATGHTVPLTPASLADGRPGCFASLLAGELVHQELRIPGPTPEYRGSRQFQALNNSKPWPEMELPLLTQVLELAAQYPELTAPAEAHNPARLEALGRAARERGLTSDQLTRPPAPPPA